VTLPDRVAQMYLDMSGEWALPPLAGISTAPLLSADGSIRTADGYDPRTGLWCRTIPTLRPPSQPTRADAEEALRQLRYAFRTFPFADAPRCWNSSLGVEVVDLSLPPGRDESAFLVDLQTAACRSSLPLAPGVLFTAAEVSGAGSGKGLLVRAISLIAFGVSPRAFTMGSDRHELEKRLAAELMEAHPIVFLDNANGRALQSDTLASVLTERSKRMMQLVCARVRAHHGVLLAEPEHDIGIRPNSVRPSQGPATLWSKDSGRRLLQGQSGAGQGALPLPRWQVDRP
jgi:hypothetical protein